MKLVVLLTVVIVILVTLCYRFLPFRVAGKKRPYFALLPKYKMRITSTASDQSLESKLAQYGFQKTKQRDSKSIFARGSVLGDFSIELAKVDVGVTRINDQEIEIEVQAGWVAAFDTGDHWKLITALGNELENA